MSELVTLSPDPTGGRLVAWAQAASAANQLAKSLVRTQVVPEAFRLKPGMSPADADMVTSNATAALLLGDELGLTPLASLRAVYFIKGQAGMYARVKVALVKAQGHSIWTEAESDQAVTVAGHRAGEPDHIERSTWTFERAQRAGFVRRGRNGELSQYELQPRAMLYARAASDVASRVAPDALMGIPEDADEPAAGGPGVAPSVGPTQVMQRQPRQVTALELPERDPAPLEPAPGEVLNSGAGPVAQSSEGHSDASPIEGTSTAPEVDTRPPAESEGPERITGPQRALLHSLYRAMGLPREVYLADASTFVNRELTTTEELTKGEATQLINYLQQP
jgi:hypothetical protein